ncbi:MAG: hypothetical protein L0K14_00530, partial [Leuconostoc sp.]|nr:hypothetical protein [Leuconostoc sp.]
MAYTPTEWKKGDTITSEKLNKIENGVATEKGPKGDTGAKGPKGDTGAAGKDGAAGAKGDTGAAGKDAENQFTAEQKAALLA